MKPYRILVTGSRDWDDYEIIRDTLKYEFLLRFRDRSTTLVVGDCPTGADAMAHAAWTRQGLPVEVFKADWDKYGKSAGPRRNLAMVNSKPDLVWAFIKNNSKGAEHCLDAAEKAGILTNVLRRDN